MKKLDSKASWLFFFNNSFAVIGIMLFVVIYVGLKFTSDINLSELSEAASRSDLPFIAKIFIFAMANWFWTLIMPLVVLSLIQAQLAYRNYKYELGETGLKKESGVIWKEYITIPYSRIQDVTIQRGPFERIFGLSSLYIETAGAEGSGLSGVTQQEAENIREELISKSQKTRNTGLQKGGDN